MTEKKKKSAKRDRRFKAKVLVDVQSPRIRRFQVRDSFIKKICSEVCKKLGLEDFELSITFVGKKVITNLNQEYRNKNYPTDVLSFPQIEWKSPLKCKENLAKRPLVMGNVLGDIVICLDVAQENAKKIGQGLDREVCFLIVHGMLHLCGHDHEIKPEETIMFREQRKIMKSFTDNQKIWKNCIIVKKNNTGVYT